MNPEQWRGILRGIITTIGGVAVAMGYMDSTVWQSIIGALATLGGIGWSIYSNGLHNTLTQAAADPQVHEIVVDDRQTANAVPSPKVVPLT